MAWPEMLPASSPGIKRNLNGDVWPSDDGCKEFQRYLPGLIFFGGNLAAVPGDVCAWGLQLSEAHHRANPGAVFAHA